MKREISPKSESEIRRSYPINDRLPGWFFRVREVSAGAYLAEGTDRYGRLVSRTGANPDDLLEQCVADASSIEAQLGRPG
jgi:hypothetical protein